MLQNAKWLSVWRRLTPLWVGLCLLSSFGGPAAAWQHLDGTLCNTCTFAAPVFDPCCETESQSQYRAAPGLSAPNDCRKCCVSASQTAPEKAVFHPSHAAILGVPTVFVPPARRETRLFFVSSTSPLDALPRPPPRGRAPPFLFSISPFCPLENKNGT